MTTCKHKFVYGGVKFKLVERSFGNVLHYFDWFYCEKCLESKFAKLDASSDTWNVLYSASPIPLADSKSAV